MEQLLRWRRHQCELEEASLRRIAGRRAALLSESEKTITARRQAAYDAAHAPSVQAADLAVLAAFSRRCEARIQELAVLTAECESELKSQQLKLLAISRKKALLEKLKNRKWLEWRLDSDREEEKLVSELDLLRRDRRIAEIRRLAQDAGMEPSCL